MTAIELTYNSLLSDCRSLLALPCRGMCEYDLDWLLNKAPLLEKELLQHVEHESEFSDAWPSWLLPGRDSFLKDRCPHKLRALRQLLLFGNKAKTPLDSRKIQLSLETFVKSQSEVADWNAGLYPYPEDVLSRARTNCTSVLSGCDWKEILPHHGPGAVFNKRSPKGCWSDWFTTIESVYPYSEYFDLHGEIIRSDRSSFEDRITDVIRAKVTAVPKDSRGPRLICVHPAEAIWAQQGARGVIERAITRYRKNKYNWIWPNGHVHFNDQTVNASIALASSKDRQYATLDLKEASDRIPDSLVQHLFGRSYKFFGCSRAIEALLPDGRQIGIECYAPMGNATTFPVQSLVFWSICVSTLEVVGYKNPADVYVFGDDIIVPTEVAPLIMAVLPCFGLVVNQNKSFHKGAFRESCGTDAFNGVNVTPIRWKTELNPLSPAGLQSLSTLAQRLRIAGYVEGSKELYSIIAKELWRTRKWTLPRTNNPAHGGIAEYSEVQHLAFQDAFWHPDVQWYCSPIIRLISKVKTEEHAWWHVLESLTSLEMTGRSNNPATTPLRGGSLDRGWAIVL